MRVTLPFGDNQTLILRADARRGLYESHAMASVDIRVCEQRGTSTLWPVTVTREMMDRIKHLAEYAMVLTEAQVKAAQIDMDYARAEAEANERAAKMVALRERAEREGKPGYFRFGTPPKSGYSRNNRDNCLESGVSCYAGWIMPDHAIVLDQRDIDWISGQFVTNRPLYRVWGEQCGTGADGEPVLTVSRTRKVSGDPDVFIVVV